MHERKLIVSKQQKSACRSCAYSPDGLIIAVGYSSGGWAALKSDTLEEIVNHR